MPDLTLRTPTIYTEIKKGKAKYTVEEIKQAIPIFERSIREEAELIAGSFAIFHIIENNFIYGIEEEHFVAENSDLLNSLIRKMQDASELGVKQYNSSATILRNNRKSLLLIAKYIDSTEILPLIDEIDVIITQYDKDAIEDKLNKYRSDLETLLAPSEPLRELTASELAPPEPLRELTASEVNRKSAFSYVEEMSDTDTDIENGEISSALATQIDTKQTLTESQRG